MVRPARAAGGLALVALALSGCIVPRQQITVKMCTVANACRIDSTTTMPPIELPKVRP